MTATATTHTITIEPDGAGSRYHCHDCRRGFDAMATPTAVAYAKEHLLLTHRVVYTRPQGEFGDARRIIADHLSTPGNAANVTKELDAHGLLAGGFPPRYTSAADEVAAIVRWRSLKTPAGCYADDDFEKAARDLAGALDAAGLLAAPYVP